MFKEEWGEPHALAVEADERGGSGPASGHASGWVDSIKQRLPQADALLMAEVEVVYR